MNLTILSPAIFQKPRYQVSTDLQAKQKPPIEHTRMESETFVVREFREAAAA